MLRYGRWRSTWLARRLRWRRACTSSTATCRTSTPSCPQVRLSSLRQHRFRVSTLFGPESEPWAVLRAGLSGMTMSGMGLRHVPMTEEWSAIQNAVAQQCRLISRQAARTSVAPARRGCGPASWGLSSSGRSRRAPWRGPPAAQRRRARSTGTRRAREQTSRPPVRMRISYPNPIPNPN